MTIQFRILLATAASILVLSACNSKDATTGADHSKDTVAATVNGAPIYTSRVDMLVKQRTAQGQPDGPELRKAVLENLELQLLISSEAVKKGMDKSPETQGQIDQARQSILANAYVQDYIKNNPVTDAMLKAEYEKIKAQETGTEYKARHILVAKEADAKDIIAKLKKDPKAFEALAKAKSMDPGSKVNGGDLGWFDPRSMVPEFGAALAQLGKGKFTSEPVKSQFGYHVILLEDSRPKQFPPLEQIKDKLTQKVQQQNLQKFIEDIKAKAKIDVVAAPPAVSTTTVTTTIPVKK